MKPRLALRFSFQAKVLAPVLAFLVLLPMVTIWIINRHVSAGAVVESRRTLTAADAVFRNSLDILERGLASRFRGFVNEPRFKAIAQLGDANTMTEFLRDSLDELGGEVEFLTYSVRPGTMLAGARRETRVDFGAFLSPTTRLAKTAFEGEAVVGTVFVGRSHYNVVCVPVLSTDRLAVAGVLTIGLAFGDRSLQELKSLTRADIAVFHDKQLTATTMLHELPLLSEDEIGPGENPNSQLIFPIVVEGQHFFALSGDYSATAGQPGFHYLLLSSYEASLQALRDIRFLLVSVSLIGIAVSSAAVWLLIRRITRPLRQLRDSAEAVGRGDFSHRVERFSNDECGELAGAFNHMTANLLASRTELERTVDMLRSTDARLRESEEQLRLIIESARDHMICAVDASGRILRWNAAAERLLGHSASEAQGLGYAGLFSPEDCAAGVPARLLAAAQSTGREAFEGWRVRRDGTRFWVDVTLSRLTDGAGFVEISRDNTLRKEAEEALRTARDTAENANRAKTEFIANMSHELRTPMNAIIGMSSLLMDENLPSETGEGVRTIQSSAEALLAIIDDILDISKIEAGRLEINQQPFDLCGCVEATIDLFSARCRERHLDLAVHFARDLPRIVVGDAARLRQVLGNLVGNAIKFTERGGVTIHVSTDRSVAGGEGLLFSVRDTGVGIPANRMERLFKMFSQVDASTTRRFGGTGLGLAIARRLVELMDGSIGVESEVGRGSHFFFTIRAPAEPMRTLPEFSALDKCRVILVGPETIATQGAKLQLEEWGAQVRWIASPADVQTAFDAMLLADGVEIETSSTGAGDPSPIVRLVWRRGERSHAATEAFLEVPMPVKPRTLHAAVLKAAGRLRKPPDIAPKGPVFGEEFAARHPLRVLLVEDNPVNARVAQLLLKRLGYAADWVDNGRKAVESLAHQSYDAVLMDLQMPEMDGLEATRRMPEVIPAGRLPYVIALTANARKDDQDACAAAGMHDFMGKPVQLEKLADGLARAHTWIVARDKNSRPPTLTAT
ncbi:MAG: response regulator [Opitutaceae bacterium]|nr:response regulator [Opitutaceae bacterium]